MTIREADLARGPTAVTEAGGRPVGGSEAALMTLFVPPDAMGRCHGRGPMARALRARRTGDGRRADRLS